MDKTNRGFTIVELLVAIVIIGILSAIVFVSYHGLTQKAAAAILQSDLKNASTVLSIYNLDNGTYPKDYDAAVAAKSLPKSEKTDYQYTFPQSYPQAAKLLTYQAFSQASPFLNHHP